MLQTIKITNFQPWGKVVIDLHPKINAIIGIGDSGKTSILRAIKWTLRNRPAGFKFHSDFAKNDETSNELIFDDGFIKHYKSKKEGSVYDINGTILRKIGQAIPKEIMEVTRLGDINIQSQFDKPLLLTMNSAELAKLFNQVADLEKVDEYLTILKDKRNEADKESKRLQVVIDEAQDTIEELFDLDDIKPTIDEAKELATSSFTLHEGSALVRDLYNSYINRKNLLDNMPDSTKIKDDLNQASELIAQSTNLKRIVEHVKLSLKKADELGEIDALLMIISTSIKSAERSLEEGQVLLNLSNTLKKYDSKSTFLSILESDIKKSEDALYAEFKKAGRCPLCLQPVDAASIFGASMLGKINK